jgi:signal transduction histidine kinase
MAALRRARRLSGLPYALATVIIASALLPWPELLTHLFETAGFDTQFEAFGSDSRLALLHLLTDSFIGLAYVVISLCLIYLAQRARESLPFLWAFVAFGVFIVSCGLTPFMAAVTLWEPMYWLAGGVKYVTAVASVGTAVAVPSLIPKVLALVDNAKLAERNRRLQDAVEARDTFLQVASHELKTPVTTVVGQAQLARRRLRRSGDAISVDQLDRSLGAIEEQAQKLARLINQLLDVSQVDTRRLSVEPRRLEIDNVLEALAADARARSNGHQITVATEGGLVVQADPVRFEQVITNLLENAVKYSPDGGEIQISARRDGVDGVVIAVRDYGLGIPPEHRARIFDRYFQAHQSGYRSGMGLGLYIGQQLVEAQGGRIWAEHPSDGGTRFLVRLPAGS